MYEYVCTMCVSDTGRGQISWNGVTDTVSHYVGLAIKSLKKQKVLLTSEPLLQPFYFCI